MNGQSSSTKGASSLGYTAWSTLSPAYSKFPFLLFFINRTLFWGGEGQCITHLNNTLIFSDILAMMFKSIGMDLREGRSRLYLPLAFPLPPKTLLLSL
jgi:hypothetical protein